VLLLIPTLGYLITIWFFLFTARGGGEKAKEAPLTRNPIFVAFNGE